MLAPTSRKGPLHVSSHRRPALSTQKPQNRATAQGRPQHLGRGCGFPWDPLRSPLSEAWPMGVTGTADGRAEGSPASRSRSRAAVNAEQRLALVRADSGPGVGALARHTHPETRPGRKPVARPSGGCCGQRHRGPQRQRGPAGAGAGPGRAGVPEGACRPAGRPALCGCKLVAGREGAAEGTAIVLGAYAICAAGHHCSHRPECLSVLTESRTQDLRLRQSRPPACRPVARVQAASECWADWEARGGDRPSALMGSSACGLARVAAVHFPWVRPCACCQLGEGRSLVALG